jgi:coenzyme F420-reducing hydrogenase beta subunit
MKAGILTFHNALNYGAVLQAYALQEALRKMGCEAAILNYSNPAVKTNLVEPKRTDYRNPLKYRNDLDIYQRNLAKAEKIVSFCASKLNTTEAIAEEQLADASKEYDVVFCGSDQVWNEKITNEDSHYFLDFVPPEKRCSYAASIGSDSFPESRLGSMWNLLHDFRAISVREKTACKSLQEQIQISAVRVLDPTFLLEKAEYEQIGESVSAFEGQFILLYMLVYSDSLVRSVRMFAKKTGMPVVCINSSGKVIKGFSDASTSGIEEWVSLFQNAAYVFTNSFHGVAFSINFNKQFWVELLPAGVNANSRITDILSDFSLSDRIIRDENLKEDRIEYDTVNEKLNELRTNSYNYLAGALAGEYVPQKQKKQNSIISIASDHCCGCTYCSEICPVNAIDLIHDEKGFLRPKVDFNKCVNCGKCVRECPFLVKEKEANDHLPLGVYAAFSKDKDVVKKSSSGGVFYEISRYVLEHNGVIFGAAFDDEFNLRHTAIEQLLDIEPLLGSKYVQADMSGILEDVRKKLQENRTVFFVGTPCQVAAVKSYCKENRDNLILCDFICHGVPSPSLLHDQIHYCEDYFKSKVVAYYPRSKVSGWAHHEMFVFENGKEDHTHPVTQAYKNIFYLNFGIRSSCYNCAFTSFDRVSDITIADYWGLEIDHPELLLSDGISMILANTNKGAKVLGEIESLEKYRTELSSIHEEKQPHLFHPLKKDVKQSVFWKLYLSRGWRTVAVRFAGCGDRAILKWKIKKTIKENKILNRVYKAIR